MVVTCVTQDKASRFSLDAMLSSSRPNCTEKVLDTFYLSQVPFYIEGKSRCGSNGLFPWIPD
jgi:hypothetical protein